MTLEAQTSDAVLLVRPTAFGFNPETAASNAFARSSADLEIAGKAALEFDRLADRLQEAGVEVLVLPDADDAATPDAVFPNNWLSFHADGTLVLYPMATPTRRRARRVEAVGELLAQAGFQVRQLIDLSNHEHADRFLEGTGSLILDRPRRHAYASVGPRTHHEVVAEFDRQVGYETTVFDSFDRAGRPIYHTNVLLSLGTNFAVLCPDALPEGQRGGLIRRVEESGREVISVRFDQLERFACNLIELRSGSGEPLIALSSAARRSFGPDQLRQLERHGRLVDAEIPTIEAVGGGSVRCMIADIHLPRA